MTVDHTPCYVLACTAEPDVHQFEAWSARKPTMCSECNYLLWGLTKQGVKCASEFDQTRATSLQFISFSLSLSLSLSSPPPPLYVSLHPSLSPPLSLSPLLPLSLSLFPLECGKICHERCKTTVSQDCFGKQNLFVVVGISFDVCAVECKECFDLHHPRPFPTVNDAHSAVNDKMQRMVVNHANRFDLLREAFNVPLKTHEEVQEEIKKNILDMVQNFSGDINVRGSRQISWPRLLFM